MEEKAKVFSIRKDESKSFRGSNEEKNSHAATVGHSGNSDVDVNVNIEIDTKAIAYAILCSALAKKELTSEEFERALSKLEELTDRDKNKERARHRNTGRKQVASEAQNRRLFSRW